jgi:hypothetical protein
MWETPPDHPLRRMFAGITEHAFFDSLGVADPPLVDYISDLLARFIHVDSIFRLRDCDGRPLDDLVTMAMEAEGLPPTGRTRREYHRHVGDFALYWSGLFPEAVGRFHMVKVKDELVNFTRLGKRAYRAASELDPDANGERPQLFRRLSDDFELCALGLHEVRKDWMQLAQSAPSDGRLIR